MKEWKEKGSRDTAVRSEHSDVAKAPVCVTSAKYVRRTTVCPEDTLIILWSAATFVQRIHILVIN